MINPNDPHTFVAKRDHILIAMDIEAAKRLIVEYGGKAPKNVNWEMVLHIARYECTSIKASHLDLWQDSRSWLARNGAVSLATTPRKRECAVAVDLVIPEGLAREFVAGADGE